MSTGRVASVFVRPKRNDPNVFEVVCEQASDFAPLVSGSRATVKAFLVAEGLSAGAADFAIDRGNEIRGVVMPVRTVGREDTPSTPLQSSLAGVGSET